MPQLSNWLSTKFLQACFVQLTGAIALFSRFIDGGTYVALSTIALAVYGAANVSERHSELRFQKDPEVKL
jgi:hypothetical protein